MDFSVAQSQNDHLYMSLECVRDIRNNILLSLHIQKGSFFQNLEFGSRLYELKRLTDSTTRLAKQYAEDALSWITESGKVEEIEVSVQADGDKLLLSVKYRALGVQGLISTHFRVG